MRTCVRTGCGNPLLDKNGAPTYRKIFCSPECKKLDNLEKKRKLRAPKPGGKCRTCGRRSQEPPQNSGVSGDAAGLAALLEGGETFTVNGESFVVGPQRA